jgi:iron complex outermembrane receptor protein
MILVLAGLIGWGIPARRALADAASTNQSASNLADLSLAELINVPVYAASRHEQTVAEAPAAVTIITHDDIEKYGYRTLAQALDSVPGFYISDDHGYDYVGVRGVGIPSDYNSRVLFLLNGLPLNDKYYDGYVMELTPDMLDAVDRIEVIKGPASALYGSDALFAIVNIITRTGKDLNGAMASVEAGSSPLARGVFSYGQQFTNGLDLFLSGHFEANEGDRNISFGSFGHAHDADEEQLGDAYLSAKYQDFSVQLWYADRHKELPTGQFGTVIGSSSNYLNDAYFLTEVRWEHRLNEDLSLMVRTYYENYPYSGQYVYDDPVTTVTQEQSLDRWVGNEAQFDWQIFEKDRLTVGAVNEYHWTTLGGHSLDAAGNVSSVYPGTHDEFDDYAVYAQNEFLLLPQLRLTTGGRYDAYPGQNIARPTPRVALVWQATQTTTLKLLYGQAFRVPSAYELTYPAGSGTGVASPSLHPEQITTYEAVLEQDFQHGLFGRVSLFHNELVGIINNSVANAATNVFVNAYNIHTTGAEAELTKRFDNGVRGFVNGTWQNSEFSSQEPINSPNWLANFGTIIPLAGDKLTFSVRQNFVSELDGKTPGVSSPNAFRTDLALRSENVIRHCTFLLEVQNLFNANNTVPAGDDGTVNLIPQPGRLVTLRVTYKF